MIAEYVNNKEEIGNSALTYFPGRYFVHDNGNIITKNAIFESKRTWFGNIITPKIDLDLPLGNLKTIEPEIKFHQNFQKIPFELLEKIVDFFRKVHQEQKTEAQAEIWYNKDTKQYFIHIHNQYATYASVERNNEISNDFSTVNNVNILNLHSHHSMPAFWSTTDDENDKGGILYCVIGNIEQKIPDMLFRTIINNYQFDIGIENIFEIPENIEFKTFERNNEWHDKVSIEIKNTFIYSSEVENDIQLINNKNNEISLVEEYLYDLIDVYSKLNKNEQEKIFRQILSVTKR